MSFEHFWNEKRNNYGGTTTVMSTLDVGTRFYVNNGAWDGEIIEIDGVKHIDIAGLRTLDLSKHTDYKLDITVKP